jgi:hypothetical protein
MAFAGVAMGVCLVLAFIWRQPFTWATVMPPPGSTQVSGTSFGTEKGGQLEGGPPSTRAQSLPEAAEELARNYFAMPAEARPRTQVFEHSVEYFDHGILPVEEVRSLLEADLARWPSQSYAITRMTTVEDSRNDAFDCRCTVQFQQENAVVRRQGAFECIVKVSTQGSAAHITGIQDVAGTRRFTAMELLSDGQRLSAVDFVRRAVMAGNSDPGMSAEEIGALFIEAPTYAGAASTREDVVAATDEYQQIWSIRSYEIVEGPTILSGLGTAHVVASVKVRFGAFHKNTGKASSGTVRSEYGVRFSEDGTPLIESFREVERLK